MKTSPEANDCARAIVSMLELETGKALSLVICMKIVACVQVAINAETAKLQAAPAAPVPITDIRMAQVVAGENAVVESLRARGLL